MARIALAGASSAAPKNCQGSRADAHMRMRKARAWLGWIKDHVAWIGCLKFRTADKAVQRGWRKLQKVVDRA